MKKNIFVFTILSRLFQTAWNTILNLGQLKSSPYTGEPVRVCMTGVYYRPDVLPTTQLSVSKQHSTEYKALVLTSGLIWHIFHSPAIHDLQQSYYKLCNTQIIRGKNQLYTYYTETWSSNDTVVKETENTKGQIIDTENTPVAVFTDDLGTSTAVWTDDSLLLAGTAGMYASLGSFDCSILLDADSPFDNELWSTVVYSLHRHSAILTAWPNKHNFLQLAIIQCILHKTLELQTFTA